MNGGRQPDEVDEEATTPGVKAAPATRGFSAQLRGVGLWDLVQMECLARSRLVVQVVGEGGVGYLYFDRGNVVHATTAVRTGEAAALEILGWTNGSFQPCDRPWPEERTIATAHEVLILQVAQMRDEGGASNLVAFPGRVAQTYEGPFDDPFEEIELIEEARPEIRPETRQEPGKEADPERGREEGGAAMSDAGGGDFSVMMRLGPSGALLANRGGTDEMAGTVAYAQRLLQLAGEILGLEPFSAIECTFTEGRCLIFTEAGDETVALRPRPQANLQSLRERLGL
jgi:hypothetical protein